MGGMTELRDKSILVVGAIGGLGAPVARELAAAGARLRLAGRDLERLQAARQPVARYSPSDWAKAYREYDVTDGLPAQTIEFGAPRAETVA